MPIYEYRCDKCGKEFEVFQGITEAPVKTCRFCQGPVKRLISLTTFHLKGTGWYVTDYGGKKAPAAESAREVKASPEGTATDKGEASPAAGEAE
ncbi:MAG TPA: zinc ribbon domain-containing protein [Syntrophales bacterium]|nr:zinc ribbon domain-containing protein [Syntrophales bacterium]